MRGITLRTLSNRSLKRLMGSVWDSKRKASSATDITVGFAQTFAFLLVRRIDLAKTVNGQITRMAPKNFDI